MKKILEVTLDKDSRKIEMKADGQINDLAEFMLQTLVSVISYRDEEMLEKAIKAILMLQMADICSAAQSEELVDSIEKCVSRQIPSAESLKRDLVKYWAEKH